MKIQFTSQPKKFTNQNGQLIDYVERCIIIDGISYKVSKSEAKVFDLQFRDYVNQGDLEGD